MLTTYAYIHFEEINTLIKKTLKNIKTPEFLNNLVILVDSAVINCTGIKVTLENNPLLFAPKLLILTFLWKNLKILIIFFIVLFVIFINSMTSYADQITNYFNFNLSAISTDTEKEFGAIDDYIFYVMLSCGIGLLFIVNIVSILLFKINMLVNILLNLIIFLILFFTIPLTLLFEFKLHYTAYLRGSSKTKNFFIEFIYDGIAIYGLFARLIIQNVRFILIFLALVELLEYSVTLDSHLFYNQFSFDNINKMPTFFIIAHYLNIGIFCIFYLVHLLNLVIFQTMTYFSICIWLFFFLYTSFFSKNVEKHFFFKKYGMITNI